MEKVEETQDLIVSNKCAKHSIEVEFYCTNCKQMICKRCVTEHSKDNHQCLYLEDYGKQNLLTAFADIVSQIKKNSEEINMSPTESKAAAGALIDSLKSLKGSLEQTVSDLAHEIEALERLRVSSFVLPNMEELLRIIDQCQKSLEGEVQHSSGIIRSLEIIQATKDLLSGLASNTLELKKAKEQVAKIEEDMPFATFLKNISQLRQDLKQVAHNRLIAYTARVGQQLASNCIYGIKEQENELFSYNIETHVLKKVEFPIELPAEPSITQLGDKVYITGGGNYMDSNIEYVESTEQVTKKAEMSLGKKWHATVALNDKEFVAIGGYNTTYKYLNVCEKYNSVKDRWEELPSLNECKQSVAACLFEKRELYVFGGYSGVRHKTVEKLVLSPLAENWTIIKLEDDSIFPPFSCGTASQISMSEILILRGNNTADSYIYTVKGNAVRKGQDLKKKDSFLLQTMYPVGGWLAVMGYNGMAHLFDVKSQTWEDAEHVLG